MQPPNRVATPPPASSLAAAVDLLPAVPPPPSLFPATPPPPSHTTVPSRRAPFLRSPAVADLLVCPAVASSRRCWICAAGRRLPRCCQPRRSYRAEPPGQGAVILASYSAAPSNTLRYAFLRSYAIATNNPSSQQHNGVKHTRCLCMYRRKHTCERRPCMSRFLPVCCVLQHDGLGSGGLAVERGVDGLGSGGLAASPRARRGGV